MEDIHADNSHDKPRYERGGEIRHACAVFDMGRVVYAEPPQKLFERQDELIKMGLDVPTLAKLRNYLVSRGVDVPSDCLTVDKMAEILAKLKNGGEVCSET